MQYVTIQNDTAILAVNGIFKFTCCKTVDAELKTAFQNGCTKVKVDFSNTKFIDSASVRQLCDIQRRVHAENFSVINVGTKVLTILRSEKLDSWIRRN